MQKLIAIFFTFTYFASTPKISPMLPVLQINPEQKIHNQHTKNIGFEVKALNGKIPENKIKEIEQTYFLAQQEAFTKKLWTQNIKRTQHIRHDTKTSNQKNLKHLFNELMTETQENPFFLIQECMQWNCPLNRKPELHIEHFEIYKNFLGEKFGYYSNHRSFFEEKVTEKTKELFSNSEPITITFFASQNLFAEARIIEKILKNNIPIKRINLIDTAYENTTKFLNLCGKWNIANTNNKYALNTIIQKIKVLNECEKEEFTKKQQKDILFTLFTWFQFTNWFNAKSTKNNAINFYFYPNVQNYLKAENKSHVIIGIDFQEPLSYQSKCNNIIEQNHQALKAFNTLPTCLYTDGIICALYNDYTQTQNPDSSREPVLEIIDQWMINPETSREHFFYPSLCPEQPCNLL
ncbi:MAG: hypothetical protein ABH827_01365 [bacterium]